MQDMLAQTKQMLKLFVDIGHREKWFIEVSHVRPIDFGRPLHAVTSANKNKFFTALLIAYKRGAVPIEWTVRNEIICFDSDWYLTILIR